MYLGQNEIIVIMREQAMNNQSFLVRISFLIFLMVISSCSTEPEDPTFMELFVGSYRIGSIDIVYEGKEIFIEVSNAPNLKIRSDYTFTLVISAALPELDSVFTIDQKGTFDVPTSRYDKNCGEVLCFPSYEGVIRFYPDDSDGWGGSFHYSKNNEAWGFNNRAKIVTKDAKEIYVGNWDKI